MVYQYEPEVLVPQEIPTRKRSTVLTWSDILLVVALFAVTAVVAVGVFFALEVRRLRRAFRRPGGVGPYDPAHSTSRA